MMLDRRRMRVLNKLISAGLVISFTLVSFGPPAFSDQPEDATIYDWFEEVSSLRSQGRYDDAIEVLRTIIAEYSRSDETLRRAYNDLVFTLLSKEDVATATESAKEALYRFPDLTADPVYFPPRVNEVYGVLRGQLFGALNVATRPESCQVFLGDEFVGFSPLRLEYIRVGEYVLKVDRPGYHDESTPVRIVPGGLTSVPLSLQRKRGKGWWLLRVGPAALLTSVLLTIQLRGDGGGGRDRLPEPPPPPGR